MGASMEGEARSSHVMRILARPNWSAWSRGAEDSIARIIDGACVSVKADAEAFPKLNRPLRVTMPRGAMSVPARLIRSRTSLPGGVLPSHERRGRESLALGSY